MKNKYKTGDKAYIVESNCRVREVQMLNYSGGMFLIRFENGGGIRVNDHRLYYTNEEAALTLPRKHLRLIEHRGIICSISCVNIYTECCRFC